METYEKLESRLTQNGGVMTVTMGDLRDAEGAGKLGNYVIERISSQLEQRGISHVGPLPMYQYELVRIYRRGTPVGKLIEAILKPGTEHDKIIRAATEDVERDVLDKIRSLVCN